MQVPVSSTLTTSNFKSFVAHLHRDEKGQSTMEILLLLFVAGLVIYFIHEKGTSITSTLTQKIAEILGFNF
jgi:hypothetical protein